MAKRKVSKPVAPPHRAVSLVQQARRVAQLEAVRRQLNRRLAAVDAKLRDERRFLRQMADGRPSLNVGSLEP